ncbi:hypothetical protein SNEBB_010186 [Seison nebaliae]|nr:hypothetical protein SNEBB_010186 [Seison nebaliae]
MISVQLIHGKKKEEETFHSSRCCCICPALQESRNIFVGNTNLTSCNCPNVVLPQLNHPNTTDKRTLCALCDCRYETRSMKTIKVSVALFLFCCTSLLAYMIFLLFIEPFMAIEERKHARSYLQNVIAAVHRIFGNEVNEQRQHLINQIDDAYHSTSQPQLSNTNQSTSSHFNNNNNNENDKMINNMGNNPKRIIKRMHSKTEQWKSHVDDQRQSVYQQ